MSIILDENEIEEELTNFLRANITDPKSRGTISSETFSGDGNNKDFVISQSGVKTLISVEYPVSNVLNYGNDYFYDPISQTITFITTPLSGTNNIRINYSSGETWVYEDFNKTNLTISDFPRVSANIISTSTGEYSIGGKHYLTSILYSITIAGKTKQQIKSILKEIRTKILNNNKKFYNFIIIEPSASSAFSNSNLHDKIIQKTQDFIIPYNFDVGD